MDQRDADEEIILVSARGGSSSRPPGPVPVSHGAIADGTEFEGVFTYQRVSIHNGDFPLPSYHWVRRFGLHGRDNRPA
jgi:hypothetical protein